jgi:phage-related protein
MSNTQTSDFVSGLQDAVRQNPVSAALIGMGVLWMFTGGSRITAAAALLSPAARATATGIGGGLQASANAAGAATEGLRSAASRAADTVRETVTDVAATVGNTASQAYDSARGAVTDINDNFRDGTGAATGMAGTLQGNLKDTFERQPLLLGAIGLALGAGMAAAVPPTQLETGYAGEAAEKVTAQVKEFATAQVDRVSAAAERTLEAVKDEAAAQGLTPQAAKDAAVAVGAKLKTVAKAARSPAT